MQNKHITVKELPISERPYEKCEQYGVHSLSDAELLAVIIRNGTRELRSIDLAVQILGHSKECQGLLGLHYITLAELKKINGIGRVKALQLLCIVELAKRMYKEQKKDRVSFLNPETIADYYMQDLRHLTTEQVILLALDIKSCLIQDIIISKGTVNASFSNPRDIFIAALKYGAVSVILLHNHPSGDPTPSREDVITTQRLRDAGELIGIPLMDHIIIGDNTYVSLKERGIIEI